MFTVPFSPNPDERVTPPPVIRVIIEASDKWFQANGESQSVVAERIVNRNAGSIRQFWLAQSQLYRAGSVPVATTRLRLKEVDIECQFVQGSAIVTVTVKPENSQTGGQQRIDINHDGYIIWVHTEPLFPNLTSIGGGQVEPQITGPYDVYLNGYLLLQNYTPSVQSQGVVFMFGQTALRCHSLQDNPPAALELNPLAAPDSLGLVNLVFPPPPPIPEGTAPDGVDLPQHGDLPGYYLFNWEDIRNQALLVFGGEFEGHNTWVRWDTYFQYAVPTPPKPAFMSGIQFASSTNCPLNTQGDNFFSIYPSPSNTGGFEVAVTDTIYGEFFNQDKKQKVQQSFLLAPDGGGNDIITTSRTKQYGVSAQTTGGASTFNYPTMNMDFTSGADDDTSNVVGPYDGPLGGPNTSGSGLSDAQIASNAAYSAEIASILAAFEVTQAPLIAAANTLYNTAYSTYQVQANILLSYAAYNGFSLVGPQGQDLISEIVQSPMVPNDPVYNEAIIATNNLAAVQVIKDTTIQYINNTADVGQPVIDALNAYIKLVSELPTLPPRPANAGSSINAFEYRTITIKNNVWDFGPWQNAPT